MNASEALLGSVSLAKEEWIRVGTTLCMIVEAASYINLLATLLYS